MSGISLYEVDQLYQNALSEAYTEASLNMGEISPEVAARLEGLEMAREAKIENCLKYIKNELAIADMIEAEIKMLKERASNHASKADWLKQNLSAVVGAGNKIEFPCGKISWRLSTRVDIVDATQIPKEYCRIIPEKSEPDKMLIKAEIKNGKDVPGVVLVETQNIQIK